MDGTSDNFALPTLTTASAVRALSQQVTIDLLAKPFVPGSPGAYAALESELTSEYLRWRSPHASVNVKDIPTPSPMIDDDASRSASPTDRRPPSLSMPPSFAPAAAPMGVDDALDRDDALIGHVYLPATREAATAARKADDERQAATKAAAAAADAAATAAAEKERKDKASAAQHARHSSRGGHNRRPSSLSRWSSTGGRGGSGHVARESAHAASTGGGRGSSHRQGAMTPLSAVATTAALIAQNPRRRLLCAAWTADHRLVAGSDDGHLLIFSRSRTTPAAAVGPAAKHSPPPADERAVLEIVETGVGVAITAILVSRLHFVLATEVGIDCRQHRLHELPLLRLFGRMVV